MSDTVVAVYWYIWERPRLPSEVYRAFPSYTDKEVSAALTWLRDNGFIRYLHRWYAVNGTAEKMRSLQSSR